MALLSVIMDDGYGEAELKFISVPFIFAAVSAMLFLPSSSPFFYSLCCLNGLIKLNCLLDDVAGLR